MGGEPQEEGGGYYPALVEVQEVGEGMTRRSENQKPGDEPGFFIWHLSVGLPSNELDIAGLDHRTLVGIDRGQRVEVNAIRKLMTLFVVAEPS